MSSFSVETKAHTFLTLKLNKDIVKEPVSADELEAHGYEYDYDNGMCYYCTKPAVYEWEIEKDKWGNKNISELTCQDCYDEYGYDYEQEGWVESDYDQELTIYRQGEQDEDAD